MVELLIAMTIVVIVAVIMTGNFNPIQLVNKANDANRKKDLARIKVSFEEYFNDKGCYPSQSLLTDLMNESNCHGKIFSPWIADWPCDPVTKEPYYIFVGTETTADDSLPCPHWYKILTNLDYKKDNNIPTGWYGKSLVFGFGDGSMSKNQVNYGVSSENVRWYETSLAPECKRELQECYIKGPDGNWQALMGKGIQHPNSYTVKNDNCLIECCVDGLPCQ